MYSCFSCTSLSPTTDSLRAVRGGEGEKIEGLPRSPPLPPHHTVRECAVQVTAGAVAMVMCVSGDWGNGVFVSLC